MVKLSNCLAYCRVNSDSYTVFINGGNLTINYSIVYYTERWWEMLHV